MTALHIILVFSTFHPDCVSRGAGLHNKLTVLPSLCDLTHPKSSQLSLGHVIVETRSYDPALCYVHFWSDNPCISCVIDIVP